MAKREKLTLIVTGKTEHQMIDELRVMDVAEELRIKQPRVKCCYLCKREEGENSVTFYPGDEESINLVHIKLHHYEVEVGDQATFYYLLCGECAALLGVIEKLAV